LSSRAQRELYKNIPLILTLPHRNDCEAELGERYKNKPPIVFYLFLSGQIVKQSLERNTRTYHPRCCDSPSQERLSCTFF